LRCGRPAVERALQALSKEPKGATRSRLMALAMQEADEMERGALLSKAGIDAPIPIPYRRQPPRLRADLVVATVVLPFTSYIAFHQWRRTILFGIPYLAMLGYMVYLFLAGASAAWVFLAGVVLLHAAALFHLGSALSTDCDES
jgi:hypothetical protein